MAGKISISTFQKLRLDNMSKKFAKLFDMPDGGQILVEKEYNESDNPEAPFGTKISTSNNGIRISLSLNNKNEEKTQEFFENFEQDRADNYYERLKEMIT